MLKKPIKKTPTNQSGLKQAYELVAKDLLSALKKGKDGSKVKLGDLGYFHKKLSRVTNSFGVYRYYRINFSASSLLEKEVDK
jgi:hypothetical protein